jgi:hypothetical protein
MNDIIKTITANILTLALGVLLAWLWHVTLGRRKLMRFFGLTKDKTLRIYIGNLGDPNAPGGVVAFEESSEARNLGGLFQSLVPGLSEHRGLFRFLELADADVKVVRGRPSDPEVNLEHSVISLGSPMSNHASTLIETNLKSPVRLNRSSLPMAIEIPGLPSVSSMAQGVIVRLCRSDKCFFYLFGITEPGTCAAARYLLRNWRSMSRKYREGEAFCYLVESRANDRRGVVLIADRLLETPRW